MQTDPKQILFKILLADDDKDDRFFFEEALKKITFATRLKTVKDGEQLIQYFSDNLYELPDVLFLDLNMPRKNGSECLIEIKNDKHLKDIPVVIYSTALIDEGADILYQAGAHYYLQKCDLNELVKSIQEILFRLNKKPTQPPRNKFIINLQEV